MRIGDHDRQRLLAWVARHIIPREGSVRAWLRQSGASREDADDLIQEAYCKISALENFEEIQSPSAYFSQIVRNLLRDFIRRKRVVRFELLSEVDSGMFRSDEPSPERVTHARRELARVEALIAQLPDRCRHVFELRKIHGVSQREIARRLGISESAVENEGVKGMQLILRALRADAYGAQPEQSNTRPSRRRRTEP